MDERRLERIERLLEDQLRITLPRDEFDRRFDRLEGRVGKALDRLTKLEGKTERFDEFETRLDDVEQVTIPAKHHQRRRVYLIPTLATIGGIIVNAAIGILTWFVARGGHHG